MPTARSSAVSRRVVAMHLTGKSKPTYTPFLDTGDFVVVVNAEKVALTGVKETAKLYRHHTGYPGGLKTIERATSSARRAPRSSIEEAVRGHAPEDEARPEDVQEAEGLRGTEPPAPGPAPRSRLPAARKPEERS